MMRQRGINGAAMSKQSEELQRKQMEITALQDSLDAVKNDRAMLAEKFIGLSALYADLKARNAYLEEEHRIILKLCEGAK